MRNTATVLIYINLQKAIASGLQFFISDNGVILTEGDDRGFLLTKFFSRVEDKQGRPIDGWESPTDRGEIMPGSETEPGSRAAEAVVRIVEGDEVAELQVEGRTKEAGVTKE